MKVLVACEYSGTVRDEFTKLGHDAMSCDILPTEKPGKHYQGDVRDILYMDWDLMIAHPPCTHLSVSGARWFTEGKKDMQLRYDSLDFVRLLMNAPIQHICIENPVSVISSAIKMPTQVINPFQFGHPETKRTCLWLKNLPPLKDTNNVYEKMLTLPIKERHRIWWMGSGKGKERSRFYEGIAKAMAEQWSKQLTVQTSLF